MAGFTRYHALLTATRNQQIFMRQPDSGTLTAGNKADLGLLDANPLERIANTRRIAGVVVGGRWFDRAQIERLEQDVVAHFAGESFVE